jgi:hypothetical protein
MQKPIGVASGIIIKIKENIMIIRPGIIMIVIGNLGLLLILLRLSIKALYKKLVYENPMLQIAMLMLCIFCVCFGRLISESVIYIFR